MAVRISAIRGSTEESGRAGGAQILTTRRGVDGDVAVRRKLQVVDDDQRRACAKTALQRDIEDVAVEHHHGKRRRCLDLAVDPIPRCHPQQR